MKKNRLGFLLIVFSLIILLSSCGWKRCQIDDLDNQNENEVKTIENDEVKLNDEQSKKQNQEQDYSIEDYEKRTEKIILKVFDDNANAGLKNGEILETYIGDFDGDKDIESIVIVYYSEIDLQEIYLVDLSDFNVDRVFEFNLFDYAQNPRDITLIDIEGVNTKVLCLDFDNGKDGNRISLSKITKDGFRSLLHSMPSKVDGSGFMEYPEANVYLIDEDKNGIYENLYLEMSGKESLFYYLYIYYEFKDNIMQISSANVELGPPCENPKDAIFERIKLSYLMNYLFHGKTDGIKVDNISERLDKLGGLDTSSKFDYQILNNTMEVLDGEISDTETYKPRLEFYESIEGNTAEIRVSINCDDDYKVDGKDAKEYNTVYMLEKVDGIWKVIDEKN